VSTNFFIRIPLILGCTALLACAGNARQPTDPADSEGTFTNPLLPSGPDPWVLQKDGIYYYMHTTGGNLTLRRTRDLSRLATAEQKVVWTPPDTGAYSRNIWAPEIHFLDGKWYIYFAADDGANRNHRMWVIENASADPFQGEWVMRGRVADPSDRWAIDGSVFEHAGRRYFVWSGWPGAENGTQNIYIAPMSNPWTFAGERVLLSTPTYPWETVGDIQRANPADGPPHVDVNEGPQILARGERLFLIYSASGCWTDSYALGMLSADASSDLLDPASWSKSPAPVFEGSPEAGAYAPGHNSFFISPDGTEHWILYHANPEPALGCRGRRSPRMQRIEWRPDGTPDFGTPVPLGQPILRPSGED
jgi:GH43 family beta-xylosidase